ncbi:MAG: phospholipid carrier-dependent glycosyltransferase, partial [Opitutaceae bacterium]
MGTNWKTSLGLSLALAIVIGAIGLRFWEIGRLEPFVDEGGHVLASIDPVFREVLDPLSEGKPLLCWIFKHAAYLPFDPIVTARSTVALFGTVTVLALGYVLMASAGTQAALIGMALWALSPLSVFHERLALLDPIVTAFLAVALAAVAVAAQDTGRAARRIVFSALGGALFGIACLVKVSALLALPWFGLVTFALHRRFKRPFLDRHALLVLAGIVVPFALMGPELLDMGKGLMRHDLLSVLPSDAGLGAQLCNALAEGWGRLPQILNCYAGYGRWPLGLLALASLCLARKQASIFPALLGLAWLVTIPVASIAYHSPYARYLIPDQLPLILFVAVCLACPWQPGAAFISPATRSRWRIAVIVLPVISLSGWLAADRSIVLHPRTAPIPAGDIEQYVTGRWSGDGLRELTSFLQTYAEQQHTACLVFVHRYSRPGSYGLAVAARTRP